MKPLIVGAFVLLVGCNQKMIQFDTVSYGTSFGHCLGYCITETEISSSQITVSKIRRGEDADTLVNSFSHSGEELTTIFNGISYDQFMALPERIGCPDCADGGAEWLEVTRNGSKKRVTFEYGEDVHPIKKAVDQLRRITRELSPQIPER